MGFPKELWGSQEIPQLGIHDFTTCFVKTLCLALGCLDAVPFTNQLTKTGCSFADLEFHNVCHSNWPWAMQDYQAPLASELFSDFPISPSGGELRWLEQPGPAC